MKLECTTTSDDLIRIDLILQQMNIKTDTKKVTFYAIYGKEACLHWSVTFIPSGSIRNVDLGTLPRA
jgi:hypothetical protein